VVRRPGAWPRFRLYSYRHATSPSWPSVNPICSQLGEPVSYSYAGELAAGFHTQKGMLRTPTRVTWYLDARLMISARPHDWLNQPMFLLLQM
jgi:hypothetical protein